MNDLSGAPVPKLSSTVLLLRGGDETEVLMVARSYQIDFASGAYVFPGGKVSDDDSREEWSEYVTGDFDDDERAVRIGGVREVFEESGLLIARDANAPAGTHVSQAIVEKLAPHRHAVDRGEESFFELIREHGLIVCLDELVPYAHWITPDMMPKRFDTRFFIAIAPQGQDALHDGRETTEAVWLKPADVLAREKAGTATLLFPTRVNLEMLEDSGAADACISASRSRKIVTVLPVVEERSDGTVLVIPKEAGYRVCEEPMSRVMK